MNHQSIYTQNTNLKYEDGYPYHLNQSDQLKWCLNYWVNSRFQKSLREIVSIINRIDPGLLQDPQRSASDKYYIINGILFDYFFYEQENIENLTHQTRRSKL